ncbi:hypothetical protein, partial [Treponema sp. R6D11]
REFRYQLQHHKLKQRKNHCFLLQIIVFFICSILTIDSEGVPVRKFHCCAVKNTVIFCILISTISCIGKGDKKNAEKAQNIEPNAITITTAISESNWLIKTDFAKGRQNYTEHQIDSENKSVSQIVRDMLLLYNLKLDDNQAKDFDYAEKYWKERNKNYSFVDNNDLVINSILYPRVPFIEDMDVGHPYIFLSNFKHLMYNKDENCIYMLVFFEENGLICRFKDIYINSSYNYIPILNRQYHIEYNWIDDMQIKKFGNSTAIVDDFNNDGYDDIMLFHRGEGDDYLNKGIFCSIFDFIDDRSKGMNYKAVFTAELKIFLEFHVKTWDYGPPVQFGTYKGIEGFIIYEEVPTGEIGKQWVGLDPDNPFYDDWYEEFKITEGVWKFYTWDKEKKKYVFISLVNPDEIKSQWSRINKFQ